MRGAAPLEGPFVRENASFPGTARGVAQRGLHSLKKQHLAQAVPAEAVRGRGPGSRADAGMCRAGAGGGLPTGLQRVDVSGCGWISDHGVQVRESMLV